MLMEINMSETGWRGRRVAMESLSMSMATSSEANGWLTRPLVKGSWNTPMVISTTGSGPTIKDTVDSAIATDSNLLSSFLGKGKFFSSATGVTYVGEWKDGMKHGQGAMYFPNGDIIIGKWARGVTDGPVSYQFNENSPWADPEY
jgi:hypothetical protein